MNSTPDLWNRLVRHFSVIAWWLFWFLVAGLVISAVMAGWQCGTAVLWALGCLVCGVLLGFLFGIPRSFDQPAPVVPATPATAKNSHVAQSLRVNTNLEQISDWL